MSRNEMRRTKKSPKTYNKMTLICYHTTCYEYETFPDKDHPYKNQGINHSYDIISQLRDTSISHNTAPNVYRISTYIILRSKWSQTIVQYPKKTISACQTAPRKNCCHSSICSDHFPHGYPICSDHFPHGYPTCSDHFPQLRI